MAAKRMDDKMELPLNSELPVHYYGSNISAGSYVGKVMLGSVPKMLIIMFCVTVAAYTTEITAPSTHSAGAVDLICYGNPKAETSGHRICHSLMATAISSIMVCMMLMIIDLFIPCVDTKFKRLAHGLSLMLSIIMGIMFLVTSSLMTNIYVKYCDYIKNSDKYYYEYSNTCGDNEKHFLILPLFGYFTMFVWGVNGVISLIRLIVNK